MPNRNGQRTRLEVGTSEPGFDKFAKHYRRSGTSDETIAQYAEFLGRVRMDAGKPLLDLAVEEVEELDEKLLARAKCYRTVLQMFFRGNRRPDLLEALPRQRRVKKRRLGLDEILMPEDVMKLIENASSLRDRAIIAVLAATAGRIDETMWLRLRDIKVSNCGYQLWFGHVKVKSQERFSLKIEGAYKAHLDAWLEAHPHRDDLDAFVFPSTAKADTRVDDGTVRDMLRALAKKAEIGKAANPHAFRHARVTWGVISNENTAKLCVGVWGKPFSQMLNLYSHFAGLDTQIGEPEVRTLPMVPALPVPLIQRTASQVNDLTAEMERMRQELEAFRREAREKEEREAQHKAEIERNIIAMGPEWAKILKEKGVQAVFDLIGP